MNALYAVGRYINRWLIRALVIQLQRLPFYRGQADGLAFDDPLDADAQRTARVPRTAYEAEWPPRPTVRAPNEQD